MQSLFTTASVAKPTIVTNQSKNFGKQRMPQGTTKMYANTPNPQIKFKSSVTMSMAPSGKSNAFQMSTQPQSFSRQSSNQIQMSMNDHSISMAMPSSQAFGNSVDTSKWGQTSSFQQSITADVLAFKNTTERLQGTQSLGSRRANNIKMSAAQNEFSISQSGQMNMKENHFNMGAAPSRQNKRTFGRTRGVLMALPEGAEGSWGDVDRNYVIGGNWKSNGDMEFVDSFPEEVLAKADFDKSKVEVVIAPTDLHITSVQNKLKGCDVQVSAQDVSQYGRGAYTGNITADQLKDLNIGWTLTGHSERRCLFGETDKDVALKTKVAVENGLNVMLCIGEQLEERESGKTGEVNARQLQAVVDELTEGQWGNVVIAYEPVWAIGTGKVATPEQAQETHAEIREWLAKNVSEKVAGATRILYGGSVNGGNCADLITNKDIDGFLVGGASLKPEFKDIIEAANKDKK